MTKLNSSKNVIKISNSKELIFSVLIVPVLVIVAGLSYLMIGDQNTFYSTAGIIIFAILVVVLPLFIAITFIKFRSGVMFIEFGSDLVRIKLPKSDMIEIQWEDIKRIGQQLVGMQVGGLALDEDYLVLSFSDKYKNLFSKNHSFSSTVSKNSLFLSSEDFASYKTEFLGDLYIRLSQNIEENRIANLNEEFKTKLNKPLEKFSYMLKTNRDELYEKEKKNKSN